MPSSIRKRAAASMPAIASKFGIPVSSLAGPWSGAGRTLNTGSVSNKSGRIHSTPLCGPYHLYGDVTSASQPSAAMSILRCGARCTASM